MFGSKTNKNNGRTSTNGGSGMIANNNLSVNMISEGTVIKGEVYTQNDLRIAGSITGELEVKGKCVITESGKVFGDVNANDIDVSGTVEGSLLVGNKLVLRKTAHILGDIYTKSILMEEGAEFQGECRMGSDPLAEKEKRGPKKPESQKEKPAQPAAPAAAEKKPATATKSS